MLVIKSPISRSKFSRIGGIYRQDRGAEYKASPPGRAMSPALSMLSHHVTHCTQVSPSLCSKCICVSW